MSEEQKKRFRWPLVVALLAAVVLLLGLIASRQFMAHTPGTPGAIEPTDDPVLRSIRRGVEYLKAHQEPDGAFVKGVFSPKAAVTALAVGALMKCPDKYTPQKDPWLRQALDAIAATQQEDGGIYEISFGVYSTSLCVVALEAADDPRYDDVIARARQYLIGTQNRTPEDGSGDGGWGYGEGKRSDLNNTSSALDALAEEGIPDDVREAVVAYINNCQDRSESNTSGAVTTDSGGFWYRPGESPAGTVELRDGREAAAAYGTMTYAGLISFLYAEVDKSDPRVQSAWKWIRKHYDLHANVNLKDKGLYYYYRIMAKALQRYGEPVIVTPDGVEHVWAEELAQTLMKLQREDGSWVNDNTDVMEGDKVMVTAYALRALSICHEEKNRP